jgi:polyisoprenoid-binding protein YceI
MRLHFGWIIISCVTLVGCDKPATKTTTTTKTATGEKAKAPTTDVADSRVDASADKNGETPIDSKATANVDTGRSEAASAGSVPIEGGVAKLTPENTKIIFVGTHVGDKPDPRTGGFKEFLGEAVIDESSKALKSVTVDIDTASLWTQHAKLTEHLNSPDFFETREHPKAKFVAKSIAAGRDPGTFTITGDLTLLATTKEIEVPATVSIGDTGLSIKADFKIDRTEFGMDRLQQGVEKEVALTVVVGEKTEPLPPADK